MNPTYPDKKLTIVGGGPAGLFKALFAYLYAKKTAVESVDQTNSPKSPLRITVHEKHDVLSKTTAARIFASLTNDEKVSVIPRGPELIKKAELPFDQLGGMRVDDPKEAKESDVITE